MGKLLHTNLKMIFGTKRYYITLFSTVLAAIISIVFIKLIARQYEFWASEIAVMLNDSDALNLYVIKVKNIKDILNITGADMMYLCFSGCFLPGIIAVFSIQWITYGYKTGMIRFLVSRGYARFQIVISEFISAAISVLGIILSYFVFSTIGGVLLGGMGKMDVPDFLFFFVVQVMIYVVFSFLCMAVTYALESEAMTVVSMVSLIVALPDLLRYLKIFTNSSRDYELLWILSYSSKLALGESCSVSVCFFLLIAVSIVSVIIGIEVFSRKEIK